MHFNKHSKILDASIKAGNPFYRDLLQSKQILVKRAFGVIPDRTSPMRYMRNEKGEKIGEPKCYEEGLKESRTYVREMLESFAESAGITFSQAVHGFVTGRPDRIADAIYRNMDPDQKIRFKRDDLEKAILESWAGSATLMTAWEKIQAARDAQAQQKMEQSKLDSVTKKTTSKKGVMKAVQVVNAKQSRKRAIEAGVSNKN
jgi:hypothetical protein